MKTTQPALSLLMLLAASFLPTLVPAQSGKLLVLSKRDHTLAVIDPATLRVLARAPVGDDPHEVIASTDGRTAFVSNYGFGAFHSLAVVDIASGKPLPSIDLGPLTGPHGLTFVAGETWFTAEGTKALGRLNPATGKVDLIVGTGQNRTHMIFVSPDAKHIITSNVSSGTVSFIDQEPVRMPGPPPGGPDPSGPGGPPPGMPRPGGPPRTDWNQTVVRVGNGSEGFDVTPDGSQVWVANAQDGTVSVIDRATKSVIQTIQADARGGNRLKFTPDGLMALISAGPEVVVIDTINRKVSHRLIVGKGSAGILVEPNGKRAFIACGPDNSVAILDLATLKITAHIDAGGEPDGMAWAASQ